MLLQLNLVDPNDNIHRLRAETDTHFFLPLSDKLHQHALTIKHIEKHDIGRDDHDLPVFTIDDPWTTEVDDGISIEVLPDGTHWVRTSFGICLVSRERTL